MAKNIVSKWPKNEVSKQSVRSGSAKCKIFSIMKYGCTHECIFGHFKTMAYYEF